MIILVGMRNSIYPGEPAPEKKYSSGLYGERGDIIGKHTDNLARRHSIQTITPS